MSKQEDTHRLVGGGSHTRSSSDPGERETYEPGDTLTPTEDELDALPDRFEPLPSTVDEDAESGASDDADDETAEDTEETEDEQSDHESDESEGLTAEQVEDAEYQELRTIAGRHDDVNGNWGEDRLRTELLAKTDGGE